VLVECSVNSVAFLAVFCVVQASNRAVNGAVPVGPPRPSSITHPEVALATVTCSYIVAGTGGLLAGATRYTTRRRRSVPPWGTHGPGGVQFPYFFPLDGRSPVSHPTCEVPFPPRRSGEYRKGLIPACPLYQGAVDRFGIPNPRRSGSVIGADRQRFGPSCVLLKRVPQGRTESGVIVLAANAGPRVPSGGVTLKRRCTYRPSIIYLIVNKRLSLSLSLSSFFISLIISPTLSPIHLKILCACLFLHHHHHRRCFPASG